MELLNEPLSPGATVDSLKRYYQAGYNTVRKYSSDAYVLMSNLIGTADPTEFLQFASGFLQRSVIDAHYYSLFGSFFSRIGVEGNIYYVNHYLPIQLSNITSANSGPLVFVGEWTAEWRVKNATEEDYQRFAAAELNAFKRATFGWSYWTLKNVRKHWSLEWIY